MLLPAPPPALRKPLLLLPAVLTAPETATELPLPPPAEPPPTELAPTQLAPTELAPTELAPTELAPTVPAPAAPRPPAPYRWPDLSVGDPNAPDPLRGLGWPELRALIYEPEAVPPAPFPPASAPETP